jgi:hypothetical protein
MAVEITRTPASNGNQKTWTWSAWIKKATTGMGSGDYQYLFTGNYGNGYRYTDIYFREDRLEIFGGNYNTSSTSIDIDISVKKKLRDISAFYHLVIAVDTTQSTASDRVKIYINGEQMTDLETYQGNSTVYPGQNNNTFMNVTTTQQRIGASGGSYPFKGLMSHVHFTDGTAYPASTFGETDSTSGIWIPKTNPSVTYGTNGFFLKFENSGNLDLDSSGNNHTFATSGTLIQNNDTPTNNYAILNHLHQLGNSQATLTNGNLTYTGHSSTNYSGVHSSLAASSGKWYAEFKCTGGGGAVDMMMGAGNGLFNATAPGAGSQDYVIFGYDGKIYNSGSGSTYGSALTSGDIICVAMDLDNNKLYFRKNGDAWFNSGVPTSGSTGTGAQALPTSTTGVYHFLIGDYGSSGTPVCDANFGSGYFGTTAVSSANADANGHGAFEYSVPTGYYAMNTKNIKEFG